MAKDPDSDGLLVILTPQAMTDPTKTAREIIPYTTDSEKPILASWMGGSDIETGERILSEAGIATFPYPDSAATHVHRAGGLQREPQVARTRPRA